MRSIVVTTVTSKGQVTIPKPVRDLLGIKPGSKVDFLHAEVRSIVLALVATRDRRTGSGFLEVMPARVSIQTRSWL